MIANQPKTAAELITQRSKVQILPQQPSERAFLRFRLNFPRIRPRDPTRQWRCSGLPCLRICPGSPLQLSRLRGAHNPVRNCLNRPVETAVNKGKPGGGGTLLLVVQIEVIAKNSDLECRRIGGTPPGLPLRLPLPNSTVDSPAPRDRRRTESLECDASSYPAFRVHRP